MDTRPIGVFDSGLGGLTAFKELERLLPDEDIVYFGDTGRVPYGTKGQKTIKKYALQDIRFLQSFDVKCIVIACGTVSSVAFDTVKEEFPGIPIIGVVKPTAKAAAEKTRKGSIGVIATSATIKSGAYEKEIHEIAPGVKIKSRACPLFVPLVENGHFARGDMMAKLAAHEYLDEFRGKVDTMILGCTHYPLLRNIIADIMPDAVLIDSGYETAKEAAQKLEQNGMLSGKGGSKRFFVSDEPDNFAHLAATFLEHTVERIEKVDIEKY